MSIYEDNSCDEDLDVSIVLEESTNEEETCEVTELELDVDPGTAM